MPVKRQCTTPNCPEYAIDGASKCSMHHKEFVRESFDRIRKPEYAKMYNTKAWQTLRAVHKRKSPICADCGKPGNVVDHIIPHKGDYNLFFDPRNLQTMCTKCHNKKTGRGE